MKLTNLALAAALMLPATGVLAQDFNAAQMSEGLTMIQTNVDNAFKQYKIDADPTELSIAQLAEIIGILNDPDRNSGGRTAKASIEAAVRRN